MKKIVLLVIVLISNYSIAQNNHIVKTKEGRRVLLKADFTWEYIDAEKPKSTAAKTKVVVKKEVKNCNISREIIEPKLDNSIQRQLKKGRATISHIKKKVAKDFKCAVSDVLLLFVSETKQQGSYDFCVKGTKVTYKRVGNSIIRKGKYF